MRNIHSEMHTRVREKLKTPTCIAVYLYSLDEEDAMMNAGLPGSPGNVDEVVE